MTDVNTENQTSSTGGGLPLRGLAMVLIAVALLLGLWGLYALTRDDTDTNTATGANGTATAPAEAGTEGAEGTGGAGDNGAAGDPEDPDASPEAPGGDGEPGADAERSDAPADAEQRGDAVGDRRSGDRGATAAPAAGQAAPAPERLHVLNNSTVPNLAADVSESLEGEGHQLGEVGNLPDDVEVLPENTVFFQPGNPAAEDRARKLADRVDGVAREYIPSLPEDTAGVNDLTLVLVGQVAL